MAMDRREFMQLAAGSLAAGAWLSSPQASPAPGSRLKAVAFDGFVIFDPRPVFRLIEDLFPGKGRELGDAWRTRQFEYQWLRTLSGTFEDFWRCTDDALVFAARQLKLDLTPDKRARLMNSYLMLEPWPEVPAALRALRESGLRLAFLSNMTSKMIATGLGNSGLDEFFDRVLSTDQAGAHKPDPRAYRMAMDAFHLEREEILFAAFAGWDAAGAKCFGYPTFWVNRLDQQPEELGVTPDGMGGDLDALVTFVAGGRRATSPSS